MASFSRAIRDLDDAIDETQAEAARLDQDLVRKLKRLEDDLEDVKREIRRLKSEFD
jgi:hypothetical protein